MCITFRPLRSGEPEMTQEQALEFFVGENIKVLNSFNKANAKTNQDGEPEINFQGGDRHGLFLASIIDILWKIVLLKMDDVLLYQKDIIRDQVRLKSSELYFNK